MPLTPADVHNVAFAKPPIGKRGYNEDEVDAFLDLVEGELAKLIEENADLRQRVSELDTELSEAKGTPRPVNGEATAAAPAAPGADVSLQAARVLSLAQEMADRLTGEAKAESDQLVNDARERSEALVAEAKEKADALAAEADRKHTEDIATINEQRLLLEGRIGQLETFEREYRVRLKSYLESQLLELENAGSAVPAENGDAPDANNGAEATLANESN